MVAEQRKAADWVRNVSACFSRLNPGL